MTSSVTGLALRCAVARIAEVACGKRPSSLTTIAKVMAGEAIYRVLVDIFHHAALRRYLARRPSIMPPMSNANDMVFSQAEATKIIFETATRHRAA